MTDTVPDEGEYTIDGSNPTGKHTIRHYKMPPNAQLQYPNCPQCGALPHVHSDKTSETFHMWLQCMQCGFASEPDDTFGGAYNAWADKVRRFAGSGSG
jgi:predicted RNA-binding Zn-ribbon protein involved in translation (DUF1610 family)